MSATTTRIIRKLEDADVEHLVRIERESFPDPWSEHSLRASGELSYMRCWVSVSDEGTTLNGFIIIVMLGEEAEIANLAVDALSRGQGLGSDLLEHACADAFAGGARTMYLDVRDSNSVARRLYESRGFREIGRRRNYYRDPSEDGLVLKKELVPPVSKQRTP